MADKKGNDTKYIYTFTVIMTTVVAVVLGVLFFGLKGVHAKNEAVFNKRAILASLGTNLPTPVAEMTDEEVQDIFDNRMTTYVVNRSGEDLDDDIDNIDLAKERKKPEDERKFPLYVYQNDEGKNFYILSVRGNGLWDEIWGNVALEDDLTTIAGTSFDHKAETPGLGAEIKDNPKFAESFQGKKVLDSYNGVYTPDVVKVTVKKGAITEPEYEVAAISGATVTSVGVAEMLNRGIAYYLPFLEKIKNGEVAAATTTDAVGMLVQ